jgi:predicted amidophosphoribosyltransferase
MMKYLHQRRYCCQCSSALTQYSSGYGWCDHCKDLVSLRLCKIPYWTFGVVVFIAYNAHMNLLS